MGLHGGATFPRRRGVAAIEWLVARPERHIAVVAHGGIYSALFGNPALVDDPQNILRPRFLNCEIRSVTLELRPSGHPEPRIVVGSAQF